MENFNYKLENSHSTEVPVLLVHGWGGSLKSLSPLQESLATRITNPIYNLELPGFGISTLWKDELFMIDFAEYIKHFLTSKNLKKIIYIGHSFGGKIGLELATSKNNPLSKLILINSSGIKPRNSLKKQIFKTVSELTPEKFKNSHLAKQFLYKYIIRERDYLNAGEMKQTLSNVVEEHYDNEIHKINIPTLIIWSEKDSYVPIWMGKKINSGIRNSVLKIFPGETHKLPLSKPGEVGEAISKWLNENI